MDVEGIDPVAVYAALMSTLVRTVFAQPDATRSWPSAPGLLQDPRAGHPHDLGVAGQPGTTSIKPDVLRTTLRPLISRLDGHPTSRLGLHIPLFRAPAACWCARAVEESTDTSHLIRPAASATACSAVSNRAQVPSRCQRRNNACAADQDP
jgi:hypothetical protein